MNWDEYFYKMANLVAEKSKDESTKVGAVIVGPDHEIESGDTFEKPVTMVLGHAAGKPYADAPGVVPRRYQLTDPLGHTSFGVLADGAGVEKDDAGRFRFGHRPVPALGQRTADYLAVGQVHLTAVALDVEGGHTRPLRPRKPTHAADPIQSV